MGLVFEWDSNQERATIFIHNVSFEEASTVFDDHHSLTIPDIAHSKSEKRFVILGLSSKQQLLVVVHT